MNLKQYAAAAFVMALTAAPLAAQAQNMPWVQIQTSSAMAGLGGQSGSGILSLPNLGTNCVYPFKVSSFGVGVQAGISQISAAGAVSNLQRVEDFPGAYSATQGEATVIAGGGGISMTNNATKVSVQLSSQTAGLNIGVAGQGMTVDMPVAPVNAPRVYVLEFGFNKDNLNRANRAQLDEIVAAWKCRFVNIKIVGHTDAVGSQTDNLKLSDNRVTAVRNYLLDAGVFPTRLQPLYAGENNQQVPTYQGVRLRANRVVVLTIE